MSGTSGRFPWVFRIRGQKGAAARVFLQKSILCGSKEFDEKPGLNYVFRLDRVRENSPERNKFMMIVGALRPEFRKHGWILHHRQNGSDGTWKKFRAVPIDGDGEFQLLNLREALRIFRRTFSSIDNGSRIMGNRNLTALREIHARYAKDFPGLPNQLLQFVATGKLAEMAAKGFDPCMNVLCESVGQKELVAANAEGSRDARTA